ncbi:MAG TPA: hypothetical protein PLQ11_11000 [Beijerinckiaceae bacterium]|nr:hypothetical protein [Beijerinckiaceae bacterium]
MLDLWKDPWPLDVKQCPCDVHFTDWMKREGRSDATVFHFGTGDHHHVGKTLAMAGQAASVLGITATKPEYVSYMDLVIAHPQIGKRYKVLFTDIYQLAPELLPKFDVVTLFHLCEFWSQANAPYARLDDAGVLQAMAGKVRAGGALLFYTGSFAFETARKLVEAEIGRLGFDGPERFESLLVYRKAKAA